MNVPADAARAPGGDTYTTTGNGEANMSSTISRVDSRSPPGVLSWTISISAPVSCASSIALEKCFASSGVIAPSIASMRASPPDASAASVD